MPQSTAQPFHFRITHQDKETRARVGVITTPHGPIHTPAFVPVGTQAAVKSLTPDELGSLGVELFFVNTYHAYLRPGVSVIAKFGGLHKFMHWHGPLITDSGGYQVFSLGAKKFINVELSEKRGEYQPVGQLVTIDDDGVTFTSHWDGSRHRFTPEFSIKLQHQLGADVILAFDECPPYPTTYEYATKALKRTMVWANRCLAEHESAGETSQALYGIVQGSVFADLRQQSALSIGSLPFDGIAIGGVAVGESKEEIRLVCDWVIPYIPDARPRHLLGVGEIDDIFDVIERGIDTFDCVMPTRLGRMGQILVTSKSKEKRQTALTMDITKAMFARDTSPLEANCHCYSCRHFSRAYIHHLFRVRELLAYRLATIHNIYCITTLVSSIREAIKKNQFLEFKRRWLYNV